MLFIMSKYSWSLKRKVDHSFVSPGAQLGGVPKHLSTHGNDFRCCYLEFSPSQALSGNFAMHRHLASLSGLQVQRESSPEMALSPSSSSAALGDHIGMVFTRYHYQLDALSKKQLEKFKDVTMLNQVRPSYEAPTTIYVVNNLQSGSATGSKNGHNFLNVPYSLQVCVHNKLYSVQVGLVFNAFVRSSWQLENFFAIFWRNLELILKDHSLSHDDII